MDELHVKIELVEEISVIKDIDSRSSGPVFACRSQGHSNNSRPQSDQGSC